MTPEEERIFGIDHPVDVDGLGEFMKGMKIDLNGWKEDKPKGIMFKHASSPAFQRLQSAIQKLAAAVENPYTTKTTEYPWSKDAIKNQPQPRTPAYSSDMSGRNAGVDTNAIAQQNKNNPPFNELQTKWPVTMTQHVTQSNA